MYLLSSLLWLSVAIIALVVLWLRWRPDRASHCGQCGAAVNATSTTCPKCSHDLREAGVSTPAIRRHGIGPMRPWLIWFLVVTVPLILAIAYLQWKGQGWFIASWLDNPRWAMIKLGLRPRFIPLIWFLPAILPVLALWTAWRRPPVQPDPQCGKCGYGVRGISAMMCPECGSNLQQVGIITPPLHHLHRRSHFGWAAGWLLALLPISLSASTHVLLRYGPHENRFAFRQGISCRTSALKVEMQADISAHMQHWGDRSLPIVPASLRQLTLRLEYPRKSPIYLHTDAQTWRAWMTGQSRSISDNLGQFNSNAIQAWLAAAGCDISQPGIDEVTGTIAQLIARNMSGPPWGLAAYAPSGKILGAVPPADSECIYLQDVRFNNYAGLQWWGIFVASAFWLLIWLLGLWWIARFFRRKVLAYTDEQGAAAG